MSFDLKESIARAELRLRGETGRRHRRDRGERRLAPEILEELRRLLGGQERPPMKLLLSSISRFAEEHELRPPSRATIYELMNELSPPSYRVGELPSPVREALHNLTEETIVPGHQLVFECFHRGSLAAMSFAAGLPWLAIHQAARLPGWRARSRGPLDAVRLVRGI